MIALDPARYTSRSIKGSALLPECRELLRAWRPGETPADLEARVLREDLLGRSTASRVHDLVRRVFAPRYLQDPEAAETLKHLLEARPRGDWFRHASLVLIARTDRLTRDVAAELVPRAEGDHLSTATLVDHLLRAEAEGRTDGPWSASVRTRVAQGVLRQLSDLGVLGAPSRGAREILAFHPQPLALAWLAYDLHFQGLTDSAVTAHPDWRVWQLDEEAVRREMSDLAPHGPWIFQSAGSVVTIRWNHPTRKEAADALARLDLR